jgi:uncharacterized protein involved in exopolysaccharide biosynthesis
MSERVTVPANGDYVPEASWARNIAYVLKRRSILKTTVIVSLIISATLAFSIPKQYKSSTSMMPPEQQGGGAELLATLAGRSAGSAGGGLGMLASGLLGAKTSGELYIDLLHSGTVTGALVDRFHLQQVYHKRYMEGTVKKLTSRTEITENKKSGVITITVIDNDRQRAQDLARGYVEELNKVLSRVSTSSARRERQFIEQRRASVLADLVNAEEQLSHFSSSTSTIDIREQTRATVDVGAKLQAEMIYGESELESLRQVYGDQNVRVKAARERIGVLKQEIAKIGGDTEDSRPSTTEAKDELYPPLRRLPELGVRYADLYRHVKVQEAVYELMSAEYETARIQEAKEIPSVNVIDAAGYPEKKSFPPRLLFMIAGVAAALIGCAFALLLHRNWVERDSQDDLKQIFRLLVSGRASREHDANQADAAGRIEA